MSLIDEIVSMHTEITHWRRDIHAHPELGFEENRTADFVASKLEEFGIEVFRGIGKTGVVGVLKVGNETRSIGLRADMDALPILERNTFDYKSTKQGTMHACGHDGHTTMLLAAAKYLANNQDFRGQVNFIFQPAEEGIGGAKAMIEDGLFEQFPCDTLYAMHNAPKLAVGSFAAIAGIRTAAGAFFDIEITGKGSHGAFPDQGIDPVIVAGELIVALQSIVSRNTRPTQTAVLSITQMHAGDAYNVIPGSARLAGTVRTLDMSLMQHIEERMSEMVNGLCSAHGATGEVDFRIIFHPVMNDARVSEIAAGICDELVGEANVAREGQAGTGSEDFSFMSEQIPSCYLNLGNGSESHSLHNHDYDFNDEALVYGASFFARVVEKTLAVEE
ncbi:MAG: M20 aminoacylase family protein [bacterium]|nr:amidohydrolase [Gammaproteobacteria bacterium]